MAFIISAFSDEIDENFDTQLKAVKKFGIKHIEIRGVDGKNISELTLNEVRDVKTALDREDVKVSAIGSPIGKIGITDPFEPHFEKFKEIIETAKILDTKYIRIFSFYIPEGEKPEDYRDEVMRRMKAFADEAEKQGVVLLHENEKGIYGDLGVRCLDIFKTINSPNLRATFDPANFIQSGDVAYPYAFCMLEPYIEYMHIKDALFSGEVVPSGEGNGRVKDILMCLKNKDIFTTLEPHLGNFKGLEALEQNDDFKNLPTAGEKTFKIAFDAYKTIVDYVVSHQPHEMKIPEILKTVSGEDVKTAKDWETFRREEILRLFETHVYGVRSVERPCDLAFEQVQTKDCSSYICETMKMTYGGVQSKFYLAMPKDAKEPLPVFVYPLLSGQEKNHDMHDENCLIIPFKYIVSRGYAVAVMPVNNIDPDICESIKNLPDGVHAVYDRYRNDASWGTISAWAWGMSRVADYLETDSRFDKTKMIALGHSRGGKTALWAGATDTRFAMAVSSCSGAVGAAISRKNTGETVADINRIFPHWFCDNFKKYGFSEQNLPVDQHMLLALMSPRPVYVSSATTDLWACPQNELLSCRLADDAYKLYGKNGLVCDGNPQPDVCYHDGEIGYHIHTGPHLIRQPDWEKYIDFADKKLIGRK